MAQARLEVKVAGDASGALKAINAVKAAGDEAATKFREQSKEAIGGIVRMFNPVVLASTAAIAAIGKVVETVKAHFEEGREQVKRAGEELDKSAQAAGLTAEAYQELRAQAELAGKSTDKFGEALARLKDGKTTITALKEEWGALAEDISLSAKSVKQLQFEAQAQLNRREAERQKRLDNESALTTEARFIGEGQARLLAGEDMATVVRELTDKYARADWYTLGLTDNSGELMAAIRQLREWQERREEAEMEDRQRMRAEEREADRRAVAEERTAQQDAEAKAKAARRSEWQSIRSAGGVEAYAMGLRLANDPNARLDDEQTQFLIRSLTRYFAELEKEFASDPVSLAKKWQAEQAKAKETAKATAKAQQEAAASNDKLWSLIEWFREARAEALGSYAGGYANGFGLVAGAGDLIGPGRYRAVTRMTEAQRLLKVNEELLKVTEQMNEKLDALED